MAKKTRLEVKGVKGLQKALKELGELERKKSRTKLNKALRPAAKIAERALKQEYKKSSENTPSGKRYNPSTGKTIVGPSLSDAVGIITAKKGTGAALFVSPRIKGKYASANWSKAGSVNLAQLLIRGSSGERFTKSGKSTGKLPAQPDPFKAVISKKGNQMSSTADRDLKNLLDKTIKQLGLK